MKRILILLLALLMIIFVVPTSIMLLQNNTQNEETTVPVYHNDLGTVENMEKETYLIGVLAAEISPDFETEALKAQAVTARSYLENHIYHKDEYAALEVHHGGVVCTDGSHCSSWCSIEEKRKEWGEYADEYEKRITDAIEATKGEVMTYQNEPVLGVFHQACGGSTENAIDVWGEDFPYLKSVKSSGDEEYPEYYSEVRLSKDEFFAIAKSGVEGIDTKKNAFSNIQKSDAGGMKEITIGGIKISGVLFRKLYALRSTNAELEEQNDRIIIKTKGNGHCVGLSQYGAEYMAKKGKSYKKILKYYFSDVKIERL